MYRMIESIRSDTYILVKLTFGRRKTNHLMLFRLKKKKKGKNSVYLTNRIIKLVKSEWHVSFLVKFTRGFF